MVIGSFCVIGRNEFCDVGCFIFSRLKRFVEILKLGIVVGLLFG